MDKRSNREILDELGIEIDDTEKAGKRTPLEERVIAGFEDIQRFVEEHRKIPEYVDGAGIFEKIYAVRLERIRSCPANRKLVGKLDHQGLLQDDRGAAESAGSEHLSNKEILARIGADEQDESDITVLRHVKRPGEIKSAETVAQRVKCGDFDSFGPVFQAVQSELERGLRKTIPFKDDAGISEGDLFVLSGQKVMVAHVGEKFIHENGKPDNRLRVIFDNGTESDLLLRSLQRALNKDKSGRRITDLADGPLFAGEGDREMRSSGTIYVLRSDSKDLFVVENRDVIHKIGVTGGDVGNRVSGARHDPTYLLAGVEIVATYKLFNIDRKKLENLLHRFFDSARLDIEIKDRFGKPVVPREWFLVPLPVIDAVVGKIRDETLDRYRYDRKTARLVRRRRGSRW